MKLYLIRHAHTQIVDGQPSAAWPLSETGRGQAEAIAGLPFWPEIKGIYSSPEAKALQTILPAARRYDLPVVQVDGLKELERPAGLHPDYLSAVRACFANPDRSTHGWEPAARVRERMMQALAALPASEGPVAVVSHGLAFALLLAGLAGKPAPSVEEWRAIPMPGWALLDMPSGRLIEPWTGVA